MRRLTQLGEVGVTLQCDTGNATIQASHLGGSCMDTPIAVMFNQGTV